MTDVVTGTKYVVVAGGSTTISGDLKSVELLELPSAQNWRVGPSLPKAVVGHEMFTYGDKVILMGGFDGLTYQKSIYELTCANKNCQWKVLPQSLNSVRDNFVAMLIPDDLANCRK